MAAIFLARSVLHAASRGLGRPWELALAPRRHAGLLISVCARLLIGARSATDDTVAEVWRLDELGQSGYGISGDSGSNEGPIER